MPQADRAIEIQPRRFISSTIGWDAELRGIYASLCFRILYEGKGLPNDDRLLAKFSGCSLRKFRAAKSWLIRVQELRQSDDLVWIDWCIEALGTSRFTTPRDSFPASIRAAVFKKNDGYCFYCSAILSPEAFHVDHKTPLVRGGDNHILNLTAACAPCNLSKGTQTADEFLASLHQ